jgi:hypothetical protein
MDETNDRARLIRMLEEALAPAEELNNPVTGFLVECARSKRPDLRLRSCEPNYRTMACC